jgi:proteasome lid subunit RPN8/RPN11
MTNNAMSEWTKVATVGEPTRTSVVLDAKAEGTIRRHAAEAYPQECCGALIAEDGVIVQALPLPNTTSEAAARRFLVGPDEYRRAEFYARTRGARLTGFYHSHPDHPARPSQHDLDHAWPNLTYLIVSVDAGSPADMTAWHLRDDRAEFTQGDLTCRPSS